MIRASRADPCREVVSSRESRSFFSFFFFLFFFSSRGDTCPLRTRGSARGKETDDATLADVTEHCAREEAGFRASAPAVSSRARPRRARGGYALNSSRSRQRSRRFSDDATLQPRTSRESDRTDFSVDKQFPRRASRLAPSSERRARLAALKRGAGRKKGRNEKRLREAKNSRVVPDVRAREE